MRHSSSILVLREINGDLYRVIAQYPIDRVVDARAIKEWLECDTAFRVGQEGVYLFCRKIEEAQIIEETLNDK